MQCSAEMMNEYRLHLEQDDERGFHRYVRTFARRAAQATRGR